MKYGFLNLYILVAVVFATVITSCNSDTHKDRANGDVIENISSLITSFDSDSAAVGSWSHIMSDDDWVFIIDSSAKDSIVTVFEAGNLNYKGHIAQKGPGPDEITVPGATVYDEKSGNIMMFDYGQLKVKSFNVDSALNTVGYSPTAVMDIPTGRFPDRYVHVNDTLGFARLIIMPDRASGKRGFSQALCRYNLSTGEINEFGDTARMEGLRSLFDINPSKRILVECATNNDLINIYDFDGNKIREIKGPEYLTDTPSKEKQFFSQPVVSDKYIFALYSGSDDRETNSYGRYIQVYDLDGNYIKTLDPGKLIGHIVYDDKRGRLLIIFNDPDIQLGYVDINKAL